VRNGHTAFSFGKEWGPAGNALLALGKGRGGAEEVAGRVYTVVSVVCVGTVGT
jgi:hypothetical protein